MFANKEDSDAIQRPKYHPLFSFEDADIVLASRDGVLFRVPSMTLKMTSSWFRAMFTLPQGPPVPPSSSSRRSPYEPSETISLDEDSSTLETLLRMACGLEIPSLETWDEVEPVLYAAEKYEMMGPSSIIRALLRTPTFADSPLRMYAAACHFGWTEDAQTASTGSLTLNLHDPVHRPALLRLRTTDLYLLFELHYNRRAQFRARLGESPFLTEAQLSSDAVAPRCSRCRDPVSYAEWRELKHAMLNELERRPAGDTVLTGLEVWNAAQACWSAKCKNVRCQSPVYDKVLSSKAIKDVLDSLPNTTEMLPGGSEPACGGP
jgi:BTB/POZ domain